ncbi:MULTISPECIES: hypothetical protein [unclassified Devosia]|uniref:hypothetical protein n=1 Tax=unclassified Devosia TaxID=196773 RepID=UPI000FD9B381|nr:MULTISPECIES: hypothetical protein [unclassified Devosia]
MGLLNELTVGLLASRIGAFLIYTAVLGGLLALFARLLGFLRPKHEGRLTANPFAHLSVWGLAMGTLFQMGWIRSMWLDVDGSGNSRLRAAAVAILGLAAVLLLIPLLWWLRPLLQVALPRTGGYAVLGVVLELQRITLATTILNILPLPGLVGGLFLQAAFPEAEKKIRRWEPFVLAGLVVLLVTGWLPAAMAQLLG